MYVEKIRVSNEALLALPKVKVGYCKMYSCEYPVKSPEFKSSNEVIRWYCGLGEKEKLAFKKSGGFVVSELSVALMDTLFDGEVFNRGDVMAERDCVKFDFRSGRWVGVN